MKRDDLAAAHVPKQPRVKEGAQQDVDDDVDDDVELDVAAVEEPPSLDERSRQILAFERRWWRQAGSKEQAIRDTFGLSSTRYYQLLNAVLDDPLAIEHEPVLVKRLRRLRASRTRGRR